MQKQKKELVANKKKKKKQKKRHIPRYVSKRKTVSRYMQYVLISFNFRQH